ncbi:hypothetical protein [Capnocytophaga sputigena]|uniref:hypothetical protein n=1 Tax=Capnocytophaga sputigena TaxID=1019 RepID=UPI00391F2AAA
MKAIHNLRATADVTYGVVINHKTTKFESNSQRKVFLYQRGSCCYQSQNYKI